MKNFNSVMSRFALPPCNAVPNLPAESYGSLDNYFKVLEVEFEVDKVELLPPEPKDDKGGDNAVK